MNKTSKILLAFATGALAGIMTGLLLAPDKASEKVKGSKKGNKDIEEDLPPFFEKVKEGFGFVKQDMEK